MLNIIIRPVKTEYVIKREKTEMEKFNDQIRDGNRLFEEGLKNDLEEFEAFKRFSTRPNR